MVRRIDFWGREEQRECLFYSLSSVARDMVAAAACHFTSVTFISHRSIATIASRRTLAICFYSAQNGRVTRGASICYRSSRNGLPRMLSSLNPSHISPVCISWSGHGLPLLPNLNLREQRAFPQFNEAAEEWSTFSSSRKLYGRRSNRRSEKSGGSVIVRAGEKDGSAKSFRRRIGTCDIGRVLDSYCGSGGGHGTARPSLVKRSNGVLRCPEESVKSSRGSGEEGSVRDVEFFPAERERISSNARKGRASSGRSLEVRFLQRLNHTLKDRNLLRAGEKVLLAVSGGQDSVCLMHLLVQLQSKWKWKIGVAHCDHQWSSSARKQAAHVAQMAEGLGLDYYQALTTGPVFGEGVARTWRYGVLQRMAVSHGYEAIVTAHTASDRIETLLFNIFRGSGLQGLQSLNWERSLSPELSLSRKSAFRVTNRIDSVEDPRDGTLPLSTSSISLVRPLLHFTRTELRQLREELELPLWPDPSNLCVEVDRNRIRRQLLPYLRKHFNSRVDKSLARLAEILHGEQVYLDALCESIQGKAKSEFTGPGGGGGRKLDVSLLRPLPIALQRRILKQFADGFTGKNLGFDIVERVRQGCAETSSSKMGLQVSIPGGYYLRIQGNDLIVARCQGKKVPK